MVCILWIAYFAYCIDSSEMLNGSYLGLCALQQLSDFLLTLLYGSPCGAPSSITGVLMLSQTSLFFK